MLVSELGDGATILLEESSGTYGSYTLMQHNYNSGAALLWRDESIGSVKWRTSTVSYYNNLYQTSYLDSYLNDTWYPSLLSTTRSLLTPLSYPVADYNSSGDPTSITRNAATVSATELGLVADSDYGSKLDYAVAGIIDRDVNYWTRQPVDSSSTVYYVYADGSRDNSSCTTSYSVFPTVGISESTSVEWDGTLGGYKLSSATSSAPAAPTALYLNGGAYNYGEVEPGTSFTLSWDASTSSSVSLYIVYYMDTGDTSYTQDGYTSSLSKTVYAPDAYSTTRIFYVAAVGSDGTIGAKSTATRYVTTKAASTTLTQLAAPATLYLNGGSYNYDSATPGSSYTLSWDAVTGAYSYSIYYSTSENGTYTWMKDVATTSTTVYAPDTYSTYRYFKVQTLGDGTTTSDSALSTSYRSVWTTADPDDVCTAPSTLYLNSTAADITNAVPEATYTLSWTAGTGTSISGYAVYYKDTGDSYYNYLGQTTSLSMTVSAPDAYSTTRSFCVSTLSSILGASSDYSSVRSITTKAESSGATVPYYNGSAWVDATPWYYNGSTWVEVIDVIYYPSAKVETASGA